MVDALSVIFSYSEPLILIAVIVGLGWGAEQGLHRMLNKVLVLMLISNSAHAAFDSSLDLSHDDQRLHFAVGAGATMAGAAIGKEIGLYGAPVVSALAVMFVALAKEDFHDSYRSNGDLKATALGALSGMTISFSF